MNTTDRSAPYATSKAGRRTAGPALANWIVLAFLAAQALDGALTYAGLVTGAATERNPLLGSYIAIFGVGPALAGAKLFAGGCAAGLHLTGAHRALTALTASYLVIAIVPWIRILFLR